MKKLLTVFMAGIAFPFLLGNIHFGTGTQGSQLDYVGSPATASSFNKGVFWFSTVTLSPWFSNGTGNVDLHMPDTLSSVQGGAVPVVTGLKMGGHALPTRAFTVSHINTYVLTASSGAGSTIIRVSDGTNNCDSTLDCATVTNAPGVRDMAPSGTCAFASSAILTFSISSSTCAVTQPILSNVDIIGDWQ